MIFNSLPFFVFISIFLPLYYVLRGRARTVWCLLASYVFYGWWDWRFLALILFSTFVDYAVGLRLSVDGAAARKRWLWLSMAANLGVLGFFKYFNFFLDSAREMMTELGFAAGGGQPLSIILPVGISFYTFQSMSYTIDIYRRQIPVERDFLRFATFISFFPQLVAGPIVRARDFLPQFRKDRPFEWANIHSGSMLALWGFFKKVVVADSLAPFVDLAFAEPSLYASAHLALGLLFYAFQIYCDFSGYSDIAIGLARMMGFAFPENFRRPYFATGFSGFWRRWHVSLSSWLRDYLYIPMGGNREGSRASWLVPMAFSAVAVLATGWWILGLAFGVLFAALWVLARRSDQTGRAVHNDLNLMSTMLLGGLWHGANYTFIIWGFLHGAYLVVERRIGTPLVKRWRATGLMSTLQKGLSLLLVFVGTNIAWVYFRAQDAQVASVYLQGFLDPQGWHPERVINKFVAIKGMLVIGMLLVVDLVDEHRPLKPLVLRWPVFRLVGMVVLLWCIAFLGTFGSDSFIYFQF